MINEVWLHKKVHLKKLGYNIQSRMENFLSFLLLGKLKPDD